MPSISRRPASVWEDRIDFERINRQQERRVTDTLSDFRRLLRRIEDRTLHFVSTELASKKLKTAINRYEMPLFPKYKEIIRRRTLMAFRKGRTDVGHELDLRPTKLRMPAMSRTRARADVLAQDHKTKLETELRRAWAQAMQGVINREQLIYVTRQVFSNFAGWRAPEAP